MERLSLWVVVGALALAGCASAGLRAEGEPGAPVAPAAVERFLQLAGAGDYVGMGWVFGTEDGPVLHRDEPADVEKRMYSLANVLAHDTYTIRDERAVPGRLGRAVRFTVVLQRGARTYNVPFTTVRASDERWYVEQIDVEAVTRAGR